VKIQLQEHFAFTYLTFTLAFLTVIMLIPLLLYRASIPDSKSTIAPEAIQVAMRKSGPNYSYRMLVDGTLQIKKKKGWRRLRY